MLTFFVVIAFLSALLAKATAQSTGPTVWASVAMIMHGERTPLRSELSNTLTPRGARQMYAQGGAFRARYLAGITPTNSSTSPVSSRAAIEGIARNVIEHEQLSILSLADAHIASGATAFMQGLYPPLRQAFSADTGGTNVSYSTLTGNFTQYPLDGYQYPAIQTVGMLDQRSVAIRGNLDCTQWQISTQQDLPSTPSMLKIYNSTLEKYQSIFSTPPLNDGTVPLYNANFWDAKNLWDYVRYRYAHEQAVYDGMMLSYMKDNQFLQLYARHQQLAMNSYQAPSGLKKGDMIRTVAGRTFARKVVDALRANVNFAGYSNKMTLMFGSHEPFLAFFSLAKLQREEVPMSPFWSIPEPGAAMVFELIGDEPNEPDTYPTDKNLYVRFLYRRNSEAGTEFEEFSLFGRPASEPRVTFSYFRQEMVKFGIDVAEWCTMCASSQVFCAAEKSSQQPTIGESVRNAVQKPFVAGIIGAAIILVVLGLVAVAAAVLGGFRIRRAGKGEDKDASRAAGLGGFKAAEKMKSDPDLSVSSRGVHHERHGSWELREGRDVTAGHAGIAIDKSASSFQTKAMDDDAMSVIGASPVTPRESV